MQNFSAFYEGKSIIDDILDGFFGNIWGLLVFQSCYHHDSTFFVECVHFWRGRSRRRSKSSISVTRFAHFIHPNSKLVIDPPGRPTVTASRDPYFLSHVSSLPLHFSKADNRNWILTVVLAEEIIDNSCLKVMVGLWVDGCLTSFYRSKFMLLKSLLAPNELSLKS